MQPESASTTIGQHQRRRVDREGLASTIQRLQAHACAILYQQALHKGFGKDANMGMLPHSRDQRALNLRASRVSARVQDAPATMRRLATKQQTIGSSVRITGTRAIEDYTHRDEPAHRCRRLFRQNAHRVLIAQSRASSQRILQMEFRAVVGPQSHR